MDTTLRLGRPRSLAAADTLAELTGRIVRVGPEAQRIWGRMTPHQMLVHLAVTNDAVLGRVPFEVPVSPPSRFLKVLALHLPMRWIRNLNFGSNPAGLALDPALFAADRRRAAETLVEVASAEARSLSTPHPILGVLNQSEWHRWAYLHTDHHLRQFGL